MAIITEFVTLEETVSLLASPDEELDRFRDKDNVVQELSAEMALSIIEIVGLSSSTRTSPLNFLSTIWKIYKRIKKGTINVSGRFLARLLSAIGGEKFCLEVDYCRNKNKLKELFDFSESAEGKAVFARGTEAAMESEYADAIKKLHEIINEIAEVTQEVAEEAADAVIPAGFIFLSVKGGLDELCKCCKKCDGSGEVDNRSCDDCNGSGSLHAAH